MFKKQIPQMTVNAAIQWIKRLGDELSLSFQPKKMIWPCMAIEFLGLELNSKAMEACLPADKLDYLRDLLETWES